MALPHDSWQTSLNRQTTTMGGTWHAKWIKQPKLINTLLIVPGPFRFHFSLPIPSLPLHPSLTPRRLPVLVSVAIWVLLLKLNANRKTRTLTHKNAHCTHTQTHTRTALKFTRFPFQLKQFQLQAQLPCPTPRPGPVSIYRHSLRAPLSRQCFLCALLFSACKWAKYRQHVCVCVVANYL